MSWQEYKSKNTNIEGARAAFEDDCATLYRAIYPDEKNIKVVVPFPGDGAVDIFIGKIGLEPITVIQCKFFLEEYGESQKKQIRDSFKRAIESKEYTAKEWVLCMPRGLTLPQHKSFIAWSQKMMTKYKLPKNFIKLEDGGSLIDLFKKQGLYNQVFKIEDSLLLMEIDRKVDAIVASKEPGISFVQAKTETKKASFYFENINNFFGNNPDTHIERNETETIYNWIVHDLKEGEKGIFILEGDKGYGKTVVLKDLLQKLESEDVGVLGIKADKYYAADKIELERKIFQKVNISIEDIAQVYSKNEKRFVVIIDQIDALSQSLSSNREYIQTYTRLISDLSWHSNVRIIVSTRTYDLNYDANLSALKAFKPIKIKAIGKEKVREVLYKFDVNNISDSLVEFLTVPNHLDIFCKLPDKKKINFNELNSLEKLFGALWKQLIVDKQDLKLKDVLYLIADKMYSMQQITIKNIFDDYVPEIDYLKSNNLIVENNNELQFFHQTFYDYTFSRQFVEGKKSLLNYIDKNLQSLYVRSVIKMVVDYYREFDHDEYGKIIRQIIRKSKYRFHLKNLVITTLGTIDSPTEIEKRIVSKQILPNLKYTEVFIGSVFSKEWLKFLISRNIPLIYLTAKPTWKNNIYDALVARKIIKSGTALQYNFKIQQDLKYWVILRLFLVNANSGLDILIDYFDRLPMFEGKVNFMERFLTHVEQWESEKLLELFGTYFPYIKDENKSDNFWFYQILEKIFNIHPEFVFKTIRPVIVSVFDDQYYMIKFKHEQEELLKKMAEVNPDATFPFLLSLFNEIVEDYKNTYFFEMSGCPFYGTKFSDEFESDTDENADELIEKILLDYLKIKVTSDTAFFREFFNNYKNSNSVSHIKILILALSQVPLAYTSEILELIEIIHSKRGLNTLEDGMPYFVRDFIGRSFQYFNQADKNKLVDIILSVRYFGEDKCHTPEDGSKKYHHLSLFGERQYQFILALPKDEVEKDLRLRKIAQEHCRKFGDVSVEKRHSRRFVARSVGPPLPERAYNKMKLEDWKRSILQYDNDSGHKAYLKGGKYEHANKFQEIVSTNPNYFYSFIEGLFNDKEVSIDYLSAGIGGLISANYEPALVKQLYVKFLNFDHDIRHALTAIRYSHYLINTKVIDKDTVNYLAQLATEHPDPEKDRDVNLVQYSRSSVRGAAVERMISCYILPEFKEIVFSTIEKASSDKQATVRISILLSLVSLKKLDAERTFQIFLKLVESGDVEVLKSSFHVAQHFIEDFHERMRSYFDKIIANEELHKNGAVLIVQNWIFDYDKDMYSYEKLVSISKTAKLEALRVAEENVFDTETINRKCLGIFFGFLNEKDDDFARTYSAFILRKFTIPKFGELLPFMKVYSKSELFRQDPRYFLQFLLKCAKEYPSECLELLSNMDFRVVPSIQKRGYYEAEPVQLVLLIYNTLNNTKAGNRKINKALSIFDDMLQIEHLRLASHKAMDTLKQ